MNYQETLNYLFTRLPMFQRKGKAAYKNNLDTTILLDKAYGNPHKQFKSIHVAGTNGKGSVSNQLAAILQSAGYKTGLYTSPHLKDFRERIRINGNMMPEDAVVIWVADFIEKDKKLNLQPSFFELTVAMAFDYFAQQQVDIAIIEVGMGGRLDSTNIITPEVSIITNIGFDHTTFLGDTLEKIAQEKAGIIKPTIPVIIGTNQPETSSIFKQTAKRNDVPIYFAEDYFQVKEKSIDIYYQIVSINNHHGKKIYEDLLLDLKGTYQQKNLPAVLQTIDILRSKNYQIDESAIKKGLSNVSKLTGLTGRWHIISQQPIIIADTGHNVDGIKMVISQLKRVKYQKLHMVFGMVNDKEVDAILSLLPKSAIYYFTKADLPRALDEAILQKKAVAHKLKGKNFASVQKAFKAAQQNATKNDCIFVGGSTFVVAEIL